MCQISYPLVLVVAMVSLHLLHYARNHVDCNPLHCCGNSSECSSKGADLVSFKVCWLLARSGMQLPTVKHLLCHESMVSFSSRFAVCRAKALGCTFKPCPTNRLGRRRTWWRRCNTDNVVATIAELFRPIACPMFLRASFPLCSNLVARPCYGPRPAVVGPCRVLPRRDVSCAASPLFDLYTAEVADPPQHLDALQQGGDVQSKQQQQQQQGLVTKKQLLQFVTTRTWHNSDTALDKLRRALALQLVRCSTCSGHYLGTDAAAKREGAR
jgi:hypothetical protein